MGELDWQAFEEALGKDADAALSLLADLTGATDEKLRALARQLAGRLVLDLARSGAPRARGVGRMRARPADLAPGDLDIEASMDALNASRARRSAPDLADLLVGVWTKPETALCLVIDKSGSMGGDRLVAAGLAAAAAAWRAPADHSVLAFANDVIVVKAQDVPRPPERVVDDVFSLRGHGPTDLHFALQEARRQLDRSRAKRRIAILLSDCVATVGEDPLRAARLLDELHVIAPAECPEAAEEFARSLGASLGLLGGPSEVPRVFSQLFDR